MASDARFDVQPTASNHFAWMNTQMSLQRTLMSAVRTAVSLIGFGFTVAQFFEKLMRNAPGRGHLGPDAPRNLGLTLIAAGVISLAAFTWQYRVASQYMRSGEFQAIAVAADKSMRSSVYLTSIVVMLIGLAAFGSVFARL
jgi:putative membrane protein